MPIKSLLNSTAFRTFEKVYVVVSLLFFAGGLIWSEAQQGQQDAAANQTVVYVQFIIFSILAFLFFVHWDRILDGVRGAGWVLGLSCLAVVSCAWSLDPMFTLRRGIIIVATTVFSVYIASCFDWEEQLNMLVWMTAVAVVGSYVFIVALPAYGLSHDAHSGDWKGLFPHKNLLGRQMAFAVVLLSFVRTARLPTLGRVLLILAAAVLLVMSGSASAIGSALVCFLLWPILSVFRVRSKRTLPLWLALLPTLALAAVIMIINYSFFIGLLGRDQTLTGRTTLWAAVIAAIKQRPWLGYGYASFWTLANPDLVRVTAQAGWKAVHAHNGYLDLGLDLGLVGLLVFLAGFAVATRRAVRIFQQGSVEASTWPLLFLVFFVLYNVSESNLMRAHSFLWLPYVSIYVSMALMESPAPVPEYEQVVVHEYST